MVCAVTRVRGPLSYAGGPRIWDLGCAMCGIIGNFDIVIHCSQDFSQPLSVCCGAWSLGGNPTRSLGRVGVAGTKGCATQVHGRVLRIGAGELLENETSHSPTLPVS